MASWNEKNRWEGWKRSKDLARDQPFYINTVTGHRQWDEPAVPASQRPNKFGPHELPLLVQMLWRDKHTFSTSYWRDQWVVLKNRSCRTSAPPRHTHKPRLRPRPLAPGSFVPPRTAPDF